MSVVLSSHLIADLERVCDYLVILAAARVALAGEVTDLLATHYRLSGPRRDTSTLPSGQVVIEESHTDKQTTLLVRSEQPILDPSWNLKPVTLDDLVLAYLSNQRRPERWQRPDLEVVR
jgi:ABC-2 type transport system ATP-binding protein